VLDLAGNHLSGSIPASIGDLTQLSTLRLSSNSLKGNIPVRLVKLKDVSEVLDLSSNTLEGRIPFELSKFQGEVLMSGNNLTSPAPLDLCRLGGFDSANDPRLCPSERTALSVFYDSAKGQEWTEKTNWMSQFNSHCSWYGVNCSEVDGSVAELNLASNGLSGKLPDEIQKLRNMSKLDLSDNDMKGEIPSAIGSLTYLTYLKLDHNSFVGTIPTQIENLKRLELFHLHKNGVRGSITLMDLQQGYGESSFITDCGSPATYEPIHCTGCTICCNKDEKCQPDEKPRLLQVQAHGFESYSHFSWVLLAVVVGSSCILALVSYVANLNKAGLRSFLSTRNLPTRWLSRADKMYTDEKYAMKHLGEDSVYCFFLGDSMAGWLIALANTAAQVYMITPYIEMAEFDLSNDVDMEYTWKCNPNENQCEDTNVVTKRGWAIFIILMIVFLLKDLLSGLKMIILSGKNRHSKSFRARLFSGGVILCCITVYTVYASAIYINATATSDTELVTDSVVILILTEVDEKFFQLLESHCSSWMNKMFKATTQEQKDEEEDKREAEKEGEKRQEKGEEKQEEEEEGQDKDDNPAWLKNRVEKLEGQVARLCNKTQDDVEQDIEQGEEDQDKEEQAEDDQLAVLKRENSEFKKKMETFSNTITRMEFEISLHWKMVELDQMELELKIFKLDK